MHAGGGRERQIDRLRQGCIPRHEGRGKSATEAGKGRQAGKQRQAFISRKAEAGR
jgi:hypothetical protein